MNQTQNVIDQPGIWWINYGTCVAIRDRRSQALLCAYEASMRGEAVTSIVRVGQDERLNARAILEGWRELNLPLPQPITQAS
jgi:hypothetical protein